MKKICDHPLLLTKREVKDVLKGLKSVLNPEDHADAAERYDTGENHDILSCKISFIMSLLVRTLHALRFCFFYFHQSSIVMDK